MGLLHSYGLHNQVTSQALSISYTSRAAKWVASQADYLFEIHRIASKVYSFVGMDERTARACRDAKETQYTRDITSYRNENGAVSFRKTRVCTATIAMTHDDAGMWHVDVTVNEDQVQYGFGWELNTVYQFFDTTFNYDEPAVIPGAFVQLDRLERDARNITGHYRVDADGFDRISGDFAVLKSADGKTWAEDADAVKTNEGYFTTPVDGAGQFYCIAWKGLLSNSLAAFEDGYDFTGTLGPLVYVSNTCWRVTYKIDVPDFDREKVIVWLKRATDAEWQDITTDCDVRNGMIYLAKMTDARAMFAVKLYYSGNGGIPTNESKTPYDPSADLGDGSLLVTGCFEESPAGSMRYELNCLWQMSGEIDPSVKMSSDGVAWFAVDSIYNDDNLVVRLNTADYPTYIKVFNGGAQCSNVITLPFRGEAGQQIWCKGIYAFTIGVETIHVGWGTSIPGFDRENLLLQVSTNGGESWEDTTFDRPEGEDFIDSGIQVDATPRLFRFMYDAVSDADIIYSPVIKYPMA